MFLTAVTKAKPLVIQVFRLKRYSKIYSDSLSSYLEKTCLCT